MIRNVAYDRKEAEDWDVEMAYFALTSNAVGKLQIQIPSTYFWIDTTKAYIADEKCALHSLQGKVSLSYSQRKIVFREVSNGAAINHQLRTDRFIRGIAREGWR